MPIKFNNLSKSIIFFIIIIVGVIVIYFIFLNKFNVNTNFSSININKEGVPKNQEDSLTWKEFLSPSLNYKLQIPSTWYSFSSSGEDYLVNENVGAPLEMSENGVWITIMEYTKENQSFEVLVAELSKNHIITKQEKFIIRNFNAIRQYEDDKPDYEGESGYYVVTYIDIGDFIYEIFVLTNTSDSYVKNEDIINTIINNFKDNYSYKEIETPDGLKFLYQNSESSFSVIVPESFSYSSISNVNPQLKTEERSVAFLPAGGNEPQSDVFQILVRIQENIESRDIISWADEYPYNILNTTNNQKIEINDKKTITISGEKAIRQFEVSMGETMDVNRYLSSVYIIHSGKLYVLQALARDKEQYEQYGLAFDEFINSFLFIN